MYVWLSYMGLCLFWFTSRIQLLKMRLESWGNPQLSQKLKWFPKDGSSFTMTLALRTWFTEFLSIQHPIAFKFSTVGEDPVRYRLHLMTTEGLNTSMGQVRRACCPQVSKFLLPGIKKMLQQREEREKETKGTFIVNTGLTRIANAIKSLFYYTIK